MKDTPTRAQLLDQLAAAHHGLAKRLRATNTLAPGAALDLGAAVIFHGVVEHELLFSLNPWLDFEVQHEHARRHAELASDLVLLESLVETDPDSPDVESLCSALLSRLKAHVAQDDRLFYPEASDVSST